MNCLRCGREAEVLTRGSKFSPKGLCPRCKDRQSIVEFMDKPDANDEEIWAFIHENSFRKSRYQRYIDLVS